MLIVLFSNIPRLLQNNNTVSTAEPTVGDKRD